MYRFFLSKGLFLYFLTLFLGGLAQTPVCPKTTSNVDIINGTFEAGNDGSFSSGFTYSTSTSSLNADNYTIASNPNPLNSGYFKNMYDHTKGDATGKMLVIDFNDNSKGEPVVTFTNISVAANRLYFFSAWFANIAINNVSACPTCPAPYTQKITNSPILKFEILSGGTILKSQTIYVDSLTNNWNQYNTSYSQATSGTVDIRIVNIRGGNASNDLALDDISFKSSCSGVADLSKLGKTSGMDKTVYTCNENFPYAIDTKLTNSKYAFSWYQNNSQVVDGILIDDMKKASSSSSYSVTTAPANNTKFYVCYDSLQDGISCPRLDSVIFLSNFKFDIPDQTVCPPVSVVLDPVMSTTNITSWTYERTLPVPSILSNGTGKVLPQTIDKAGTYRLTIIHGNSSCTASPDLIKIDTLAAAFTGAINVSCIGTTSAGTSTLIADSSGAGSVTLINGTANVSWYNAVSGGTKISGSGKSVQYVPAASLVKMLACPQGGLYLQDDNSFAASLGGTTQCTSSSNTVQFSGMKYMKIKLSAPATITSINASVKTYNASDALVLSVEVYKNNPTGQYYGSCNCQGDGPASTVFKTGPANTVTPGSSLVDRQLIANIALDTGTYWIKINNTGQGGEISNSTCSKTYPYSDTKSVITATGLLDKGGNKLVAEDGEMYNLKFQVGNPTSCGRVWVCATCTLPVEYTYFNVYPTGGKDVLITWGTAHESKNRVFAVEVSSDGVNFVSVAEVSGSLNSHLQKDYSVQQTMSGDKQYYRIKQVDLDGKITYTPVRFVSLNSSDAIGELYPQPVKHGEVLHVKINGLVDTQLTLKLQSISGFDISDQTVDIGENTEAISFNTASLNAGVYLLLISNSDFAKTIRVVVE